MASELPAIVILAIGGAFAPVLAKHTKSFNLIDKLSVGMDRIQRNFEPLQRQVELWRTQITDEYRKADLVLGVRRRQVGSATKPAARGPPPLFRAAIPGILGQDHVELVERFHQRIQEADPLPQQTPSGLEFTGG